MEYYNYIVCVSHYIAYLIKDLEYQIHQATKAYNDTIRVYEQKLQALGVPPEEIGFEYIPSITSQMPAGLVTKVN